MSRLLIKMKIALEMIMVQHTIFALPFAFLSAFIASRGLPSVRHSVWILVAMIGARSAAMAFNRLVDRSFDAQNPRTSNRALPRNLLSRNFVILFTVVSSLIFVLSAYHLNRLAFGLSPVALAVIFLYSYTKRFTWTTHFFLGSALACAPIGAWIAIRGDITATPLLLGLAVALWAAGLDIIYACQDFQFDLRQPLFSVPKRFGLARALWISAFLHFGMLLLLGFLFWRENLGAVSLLGLGLVGGLLGYEHALVKPSDLSRVNTAFFSVNGWISILLFLAVSIDILLGQSQ